MKKLLILFGMVLSLSLVSCGIGNYSHSSGMEDQSYLVFTANKKFNINVDVDGQKYEKQTIKQKAYKSGRNIKKLANESIKVPVGKHVVKVCREDGTVLLNKTIFVSTTETKNIQL